MHDDDRDDPLSDAARDYHRPPPAPVEAMWRAIERERRAAAPARRPRVLSFRRWAPLAAAAAAVLAAGIGIGRVSREPAAAPAAIVEASSDVSTTAYRLAALEHLGQSEEFLTLFRASVHGGDHRLASATARRLLGSNRLLLDSPAASDRRVRLLLEDLELVLAGIAQLSDSARGAELDLITEGMERGNVMPRLRTAVPSGAAPSQGVL